MDLWKRLTLAILVVLVDSIAFAVPLTALAIAYVLLARPPWFVAWVRDLYGAADAGRIESE
jgi:presenilin-like A22 family membrane protease